MESKNLTWFPWLSEYSENDFDFKNKFLASKSKEFKNVDSLYYLRKIETSMGKKAHEINADAQILTFFKCNFSYKVSIDSFSVALATYNKHTHSPSSRALSRWNKSI